MFAPPVEANYHRRPRTHNRSLGALGLLSEPDHDAAVHVYGALCRPSPRCASLMVVELAILTNEEDAFVRRDALGYVALAALLEVVGSPRQGYVSTVRLLIDHDARDHDGPVVLCMRVSWAHLSGRHFDKRPVRAVGKIATGWRGVQFTVHAIR